MTPNDASPDPRVAVIVVAAGGGARLGAGMPKAFAPLGGGTILGAALAGVRRARLEAQCVVVVPRDRVGDAERIARAVYGGDDASFVIVPGGAERAESVAAGLGAVAAGVQTVLVHDAARALTPPAQFEQVAALVVEHDCGVVPVRPVVDTVKRVAADGRVVETLDRGELALAETPQGFPRHALERAVASAGAGATAYTDDAALAAAAGVRVITAEGHELAFKITTPEDLSRAEAILGAPEVSAELRTGVGVDAHRLVAGIPLWLGGVEWPGEPAGLAGHSDGDVACHAIVDALLSAAGEGDIGTVFGVDDPDRAGTRGATFIRETVELLARAGWRVRSVSVEIVANAPRIGLRRDELERTLAGLVGAPVAVAGTTSDGLGLAGDGEGIAAVATALVSREPAANRLIG